MKLDYKRTILVGFAFFLICAFWQAYDATIPVILTNKFGMSQTWSGLIMALDNILAVFMLPIFGALSDKYVGKKSGKRTPFIMVGTIIAAVVLVALSFVDAAQLKNISDVSKIDDPATLGVIYEQQAERELMTPDGDAYVLKDKFTKEQFMAITSQVKGENDKLVTNPDYTNYVAPARQACAADATAADPTTLILFVALLLAVLISMSIFRSPAVALMPDVTIKPLRSKANAIINLMGTAGGILVLVLGIVFATGAVKNSMMNYTVYYGVIAALMLGALLVFRLTVREPQWAAEMRAESERLGIDEAETEENKGNRRLDKAEKRSLLLILASVALWYIGYNAITSKYSLYASRVLDMDYNTTLLLAQGAAIVAYIPAGIVASKIGRKKTILGGVVMLTTAFAVASFLRAGSSVLVMNVLFILAGIGWATINVNSFPMVVELSSGSDIGKYTGYYYTASMAAQIVTPVFSGALMDLTGKMTILFPYAAIFAGLAFVTMAFVRHGDSRPETQKGLEALNVDD
ncbi:MAG: SLC45 family MFS transporter [Ruminococcaceae bacterium]|nr:SLC45 family MFS transporter [Oscillospiraceae bacterium]